MFQDYHCVILDITSGVGRWRLTIGPPCGRLGIRSGDPRRSCFAWNRRRRGAGGSGVPCGPWYIPEAMSRRDVGEGNAPARTRPALRWVLAAAVVAAALPPPAARALPPASAGGQSLQPAGWDAGLRMAEAVDRNPDPDVVEVDFEARVAKVRIAPELEVEAWTYNGTIPGPMIRVEVGDRLIVHFTNNLPRSEHHPLARPAYPHRHGRRAGVLAGAGPAR